MSKNVTNPPAGGPQAFASTNDENANPVLRDKPYVVAITAHGQVGVVDRFASESDANSAAQAIKESRPGFVNVRVVRENDPDNGLPALLAEVEGAELGEETQTETPKSADAPKATDTPKSTARGK